MSDEVNMNPKFKTLNVSPESYAAFQKLVIARGWGTAKNGFEQLLKIFMSAKK
jgi:hypothetical protein